jgi:GAF domain-containing protein
MEKQRVDSLLKIVIPIGVQLSTEKSFGRLLENMLVEAQSFCKADAGTLYLMKEDRLEFAVVRNNTLRIAMGGTNGSEITLPPLSLNDEAGHPNQKNLATHAALTGKTVNLEDAYETTAFDLSFTRAFDKTNGYLSVSFLTIPLKSNDGKVLGVLQLINPLNSKREIVPFDKNLQQLMESFSSLATAALEGYIEEQRLRNEIRELRIEIDAVKRAKQVDEITNTDYFKELQERAKTMRDSNTGPVNAPKN